MMNTADLDTQAPPQQSVPELLPAERQDDPARFALPGILALLIAPLMWFSPARMGVRLASAGWSAAVLVYLLSTLYGLGMILWAEAFPSNLNPLGHAAEAEYFPGLLRPVVQMTPGEIVRGPLIALVTVAHRSTAAGTFSWWAALSPLWLLGIVLLAALTLMPFAAAGERTSLLFGRCVRLSLWSSTLLVPLGLGWLLAPRLRDLLNLPAGEDRAYLIVLSAFALWWMFVLLRSGYRYAGRPDGPSWEPRHPRCEQCGYNIAHLPHETNCPECGRQVALSLPERRELPAFAAAETRPARAAAYWTTLSSVLINKRFFNALAVHAGHPRARTFFLFTAHINAGLVFLIYPAVEVGLTDPLELVHYWPRAAAAGAAALLIQVALPGLLCLLGAIIPRRPMRPVAVSRFYAVSSLLAAVIGALVAAIIAIVMRDYFDTPIVGLAKKLGIFVAVFAMVAFAAAGPYIIVANIVRASRHTRIANA